MPVSVTKLVRVAGTALTWLVLGALALTVVAIQVVPWALGGKPLVVLTGSMEPTLHPGDIIAVKAADVATIGVGDVVTFQPVSNDPALVTHRVVAKSTAPDGTLTFVTRGDANDASDEPIVAGQLKGQLLYRIPYLGWALNALGGPGSGAVKIAAVALIAGSGWMLAGGSRRRSRPSSAEVARRLDPTR